MTPSDPFAVAMPPDRIEALIAFFERLTPQSLKELPVHYASDVHFRDPFNDVHGLDAMHHIFSDMFDQLSQPRFVVRHWAAKGSTLYLAWDFHFSVKVMGRVRSQRIEGMSECRWAQTPQGEWRIQAHLDHWDSATQVYAQLPVVGGLIRWFRKRLSAA